MSLATLRQLSEQTGTTVRVITRVLKNLAAKHPELDILLGGGRGSKISINLGALEKLIPDICGKATKDINNQLKDHEKRIKKLEA